MPRHYMATARREAWIKEHGPCAVCGTWDNLQVDHIDPRTKAVSTTSVVWGWSDEARRETELSKCQVLCDSCHKDKTAAQKAMVVSHGTYTMYNNPRYKCRCDLCVEAFRIYQHNYRVLGRRLRTD